jgi:YHS domain-containing protein
MTVEVATARHTYDHEGQHFYFCCPGCRKAFANAPEQYLTNAR